jgi:hypothetical protein
MGAIFIKELDPMAFNLKTRIWQTGSLDWWGMIGGEDVYLGNREFPLPPDEGDQWHVHSTGDVFKVIDGEIVKIDNRPVEKFPW